MEQELIKVKEKIQEQDKQLKQTINILNEQENRNRRSNIKIRSLTENVCSKDMITVLQKFS